MFVFVLCLRSREHARQHQERLLDGARRGNCQAILAVLRSAPSGFDVNLENAAGQSALYFAALGGHVECVRALVLIGGAIISCRALDSATDAVRRLLRKIAPHSRDAGTGGALRTRRSSS